MENAIISIICIALLLFGGMTMSQGFLSSVDSNNAAWAEMGERDEEIMRTEVSQLAQIGPGSGSGGLETVEVSLTNSGQTKLYDFSKWDVIVQYYDTDANYHIKWLPYTQGTPVSNEWTVEGIYLDVDDRIAEVFEPNILNAGEKMVIQAKLNPPVGEDTTNQITVSVPNGVSVSTFFYGYQ